MVSHEELKMMSSVMKIALLNIYLFVTLNAMLSITHHIV
jgi:hypothetical protein